MKKSDLMRMLGKGGLAAPRAHSAELAVDQVRMVAADGLGYLGSEARNPFARLATKPDRFKAYVDFQICHAFPQITGPTSSGAFLGYHPAVLEKSHGSLLHQWMNLRHQTKSLDPAGKARDRIVGCVIATDFPARPAAGWAIPAAPAEAPFITARAVLFKHAEGLHTVLGQHQADRKPWSVSIEADADMENIGLYLPSTREIWSLMDAPDDLLDAVSVNAEKNLVVGRARGEQLAFAYGVRDGAVQFAGVGMTPTPAERAARITSIQAEEGGQYWSVAAEGAGTEEQLLVGRRCTWDGGLYRGVIAEVKKEGKMIHPTFHWPMHASEDNPAVKIYLADRQVVLKRFENLELA